MSILDGPLIDWSRFNQPVAPLKLTRSHIYILWRVANKGYQWLGSTLPPDPNFMEISSQLYNHGYLKFGNNGIAMTFKGLWALHTYKQGKA
jgi:hypothetical protein